MCITKCIKYFSDTVLGWIMGKLSDAQIRAWIKADERFSGRSDGDGLTLRYLASFKSPSWRFRYSIAGRPRVMELGSYRVLSLKDARAQVKILKAKVSLGIDPQLEKADLLQSSVDKLDKSKQTVDALSAAYFENRQIKTAYIERARVAKDLLSVIGSLPVQEVRASHVIKVLDRIKKRGAPTAANKLLRLATKIFNHGVKIQWLEFNVWAAFEVSDAGGAEKARDRWLSESELKCLFSAMNNAKGWSFENDSAVKLLLLLGVRKMELIGAPLSEINLDDGIWVLPAYRTKRGRSIDIPLPHQATSIIRRLVAMNGSSEYLFPARKIQTRLLPHISPDTVNASLKRFVKLDIPLFTIHDFRRTCRTHLERLGFDPRIGESVLNHKVRGVEGVYNRHDYFEERREALQVWADYLDSIGLRHV